MAQAQRLGITYEVLLARLEPTAEEKEASRVQEEEEDRRDTQRLDAVRQAFWEGTEADSSELYVLSDALNATGIEESPRRSRRPAAERHGPRARSLHTALNL